MAKKSTKSTRRLRSKKALLSATVMKRMPPRTKAQDTDVDTRPDIPIEARAPDIALTQTIDEFKPPKRLPMLVSLVALIIVMTGLIMLAIALHTQHDQMVNSSSQADQILQAGGKVCTTGDNALQPGMTAGSTGTLLQQVPTNDIQTPQGLSSTNSDITTLQPANCF